MSTLPAPRLNPGGPAAARARRRTGGLALPPLLASFAVLVAVLVAVPAQAQPTVEARAEQHTEAQGGSDTSAPAGATPLDSTPPADPSPLPDPRRFHRGLYADAEAGSVVFLGAARDRIGPGVAFGLRVGYDLLRFVGVQVFAGGSSHALSPGDGPSAGQLLQLYLAGAELELRLPIGRLAIVGRGRGGLVALSTNILGTSGLALTDPEVRSTPFFGGGLGLDFHTLSRHFSFGLHTSFVKLQKLKAPGAVTAGLDVRYTF
jgi:hypothetical protein